MIMAVSGVVSIQHTDLITVLLHDEGGEVPGGGQHVGVQVVQPGRTHGYGEHPCLIVVAVQLNNRSTSID